MNPIRLLSVFFLVILFHFGCGEPHVVIEVDDKVPPSFKFDGTGAIPFLVVYELPSATATGEDMSAAKIIWEIRPNDLAHARVPLRPTQVRFRS